MKQNCEIKGCEEEGLSRWFEDGKVLCTKHAIIAFSIFMAGLAIYFIFFKI